MDNAINWKKILVIGALLLAPLALTQCGSAGEQNSAEEKVGPVGPTYPSRYYFDLSVAPIIVQSNGTVTFTVQVHDSRGNVAGGVSVILAGPDTSTSGVTDSNGFFFGVLEVKGTAGSIIYVTGTVEDMSLTIPVQVIPSTSGGGSTGGTTGA
ncbi:MAG: hypothetical protein HY751_06995 [Nitrospinae bacterium]|nr:hypothetical protein [Nitrospinota bacterium]